MQTVRTLFSGRFTGDVLWNVGSLVFLAAGGLLINGLIVTFRGTEALGVFNQVYAFYIVLSQIGVGGLQHSVLKHVSYEQDDLDTCADLTAVALMLIFAITVPIGIVGIMLADSIGDLLESPDVAQGLVYVMPGLVFFAANKVLINALNGLRRMRVYAMFRSLRFILIPGFIIVIIALDSPISHLPLALTLAELVLFVVLMIYLYTQILPLRSPHNFRTHTRAHFSYGIRGMMSGVLTELNTRIDVLMLGLFLSDRAVGLYSFAAVLAEGFAQIPIAVRYNVDPLIGDYFAKDQRSRITDLAQKIRRYFLPAMALLGVVSVLAYPVVYVLLAGTDGLYVSWVVFAVLAVAHIAIAGYTPMRGILLQGGAPGVYTLVILATALTNILLNALLIPQFQLYGAAIATACTITLEMILIFFLSRRLFGVRL